MSFETELVNYIREKYEVEYTSTMKLTEEEGSYVLELALNRENKPLVISGQFDSESEFLDYVKKEVDKRRFFILEVYKIANINTYPDNELL